MDQNYQSEDQINKKQFLKRTMQLVLSVSVFSVFVWYSSGFSIHPQSFNAYFSTCLLSMITHTLERKYMFLICNGILAFVAKTSLKSSFSPPPSSSDSDFDQFLPSNLSEIKTPVSDMVLVPLMGTSEPSENVERQVKWEVKYNEEASEEEEATLCNKTKGAENEAYNAEEEIKWENEETESEVEVAIDDDLEESTTKEDLASAEELNRKFEEFIRKMKEEIRIEAKRQLIAV
ncbi:hypothetical protein RJT34_14310 [Clitoria ternatea]|uniref:Transmembrane protein n=1 Tax=Clitoria ternatea TaxID=43366 RepID=A0AAN9JSE5_CLITE